MIEIYKKLPKTNCGECGDATCTAFALKVMNSQRRIQDCPYVANKDSKLALNKPVATMDDNYSRVSYELEAVAKRVNFKDASAAIGGGYEFKDGEERITLKMINKPYEIRRKGLYEKDTYCLDSWSKIIIYDYVRRKGSRPLTGEWVTLGYFPNTASHVKAFQRNAEEKIAIKFNGNKQGLIIRCKELGGVAAQGQMKADYIYQFGLLPMIPLYMCFWEADDEFPASCKLFLDNSAEDYIDIEYLAYLVERFVEIFVH